MLHSNEIARENLYIEHKYPCFTAMYQALLRQCPVNLSAALFLLQVATCFKSLRLHFPICCDISAFVSVIHANFATIWASKCSATIKIASLTFLLKYSVQYFIFSLKHLYTFQYWQIAMAQVSIHMALNVKKALDSPDNVWGWLQADKLKTMVFINQNLGGSFVFTNMFLTADRTKEDCGWGKYSVRYIQVCICEVYVHLLCTVFCGVKLTEMSVVGWRFQWSCLSRWRAWKYHPPQMN